MSRVEEVAAWLLAARRGKDWDETDARLCLIWPDLDEDELDAALHLVGDVLDGRMKMAWGFA